MSILFFFAFMIPRGRSVLAGPGVGFLSSTLPRWLSGKESTCQCRKMQETWVPSLGQEDPLEEEMATHSSIPAWEIHGQRSLAGYSHRVRVGHNGARTHICIQADRLLCKAVLSLQNN